jgi:hypothetical protein
MKRGALFPLPVLVACHGAPATPPPGEVWILPRQVEAGDTGTAPTAARRVEKDDVRTHGTVEKAGADLLAAEHDLQRQEELCRLCGGLCGRDVQT